MTRLIKVFPFLLVFMFSIFWLTADPVTEGPPPPGGCDPSYKTKVGEIVLDVEKLKEQEHTPHPWVCVYTDRQNSVLWQTKTFKSFTVELQPQGKADPKPFSIEGFESTTPQDKVGVNAVLSSGPPKKGLEAGWHLYKIKITYKDQDGQEHVIDPHLGVHH
jgi:hypothetical protein